MNASFCTKQFLCVATLALGILAGTSAQAQSGGIPVWTNIYDGPGNDYDSVKAMAVDSSGNVFVTGYVNNIDSSDFATIKYSGAGEVLWVNLYDGPEAGFDAATAIAVDSSDNVLVTGYSWNGSSHDYATIKYSSAGVPLWTNWYNGPQNGDERVNAVAVDSSGDVIVTGASHSGVDYATPSDYATIKYSSAGAPLWTNRYNGPGNGDDSASAVAVDLSGNVFVTGSSVASGGGSDYATIKYSGAGVALWTNRYNGPGNGGDGASAVAVDGSNNVFVTGSSVGSGSGSDYATIKYSSTGVASWTNRYNGSANASDRARTVAVDGSGNVFVTGSANGDYYGAGFHYATIKYSGAGVPLWTNGNHWGEAVAMAVDRSGNVIVTGTDGGDYATIKYSGTGVPLWTNYYNGPGDDIDTASALAVDASGNVFVTGSAYGGYSYYGYATVKYEVAPLLSIGRPTTDTVALSWPSPWTGFTLQQNTNGIATPNWSNVLTTPTDNGTNRTVIVNLPTGNRFYRLKSQ